MKITLTVAAIIMLASVSYAQEGIEELNNARSHYEQAFNDRDVDGIMAGFWNNPNLATCYPDSDYHGYDATRKGWERFFAQNDSISFLITDSHPVMVDRDYGFDWGHYNLSFVPKGGVRVNTHGRYLRVYTEKNRKWLVAAEYASLSIPEMMKMMPSPAPGK